MAVKQNSSKNKKGEITRSDRMAVSEQAAFALKRAKEKAGKVIHIAISDRTTIELPANLSEEEVTSRINKYIKLHKSKI